MFAFSFTTCERARISRLRSPFCLLVNTCYKIMLKKFMERTEHETLSLLHIGATGTVKSKAQLKAKKLNVPVNVRYVLLGCLHYDPCTVAPESRIDDWS